jgi:hypothetical protein
MMLGILGNIADYQEALRITRRFMAAVPTGSYLAVRASGRSPCPDRAGNAAMAPAQSRP